MKIYATSDFIDDFSSIQKNKKHYGCIEKRFCKKFANKDINTIFNFSFVTHDNGHVRFLKIRLKSCTNKGSSSGFRALCIVKKDEEECYFFCIYPKVGPLGKESINDNQYRTRVKNIQKEKKQSTISEVKFNVKRANKTHKVLFT